jgi:Lon protease-like protein
MPRLPLFPLGTVLVPGADLPLQVFEPRYVTMLGELLRGADRPEFGVVAIRHGIEVGPDAARELYDVGCVAVVTGAARLDDGRYVLVAEGTTRFRLEAVVADSPTPYLIGDTSPLPEAAGAHEDEVAALAARVREALVGHARALGVAPPRWPDDPLDLSYAVGTALGLELGERQQLLATPDTASRLRLGLELVRRERRLASTLHVVTPAPTQLWNPN